MGIYFYLTNFHLLYIATKILYHDNFLYLGFGVATLLLTTVVMHCDVSMCMCSLLVAVVGFIFNTAIILSLFPSNSNDHDLV